MRLHVRRAIGKCGNRIRRHRNYDANLAFGRRDDGNGRRAGIRRDDRKGGRRTGGRRGNDRDCWQTRLRRQDRNGRRVGIGGRRDLDRRRIGIGR